MPTTRRSKGAVLAPVYDDPMPRKQRSRATSVASSQRSNEPSHVQASALNALSSSASHNEELSVENEDLRKELEKQKTKRWTLRDKQLASQLAEHRTQQSEEPEPAPSAQTERTPTAQKNKNAPPTPSPVNPQSTTTPTSQPRWRQFLSSFTGFTPFSARRPIEPATEPPKREDHSPLGLLPQNRKRSAAQAHEEDETPVKRNRTPEQVEEQQQQQQQEHTARKPPPSASKPLETISEQIEPGQQQQKKKKQTTARPATPTRASRRKAPAPQSEKITRTEMQPEDSTPKRRTIRDARQSREARHAIPPQSARQLKRWEAPQKPREPNADKRLARMQQLEKLKAQKLETDLMIARLTAEQEADGIDTRKRKRVKVDELAFIPHNQPGDAEGTFRVPEWDSDDEMEVDEAVPVRKNVFMVNAENQQTQEAPKPVQQPPTAKPATSFQPPTPSTLAQASPPKPQLPPAFVFKPAVQPSPAPQPSQERQPTLSQPQSAPVQQPKQLATTPPVASATKPKKTFAWPSVGSKNSSDVWPEQRRIAAGQKFARGFEAWSAVSLQAH